MAVNEKLIHITIFSLNFIIMMRLMLVGRDTVLSSNPYFSLYRRFNMRFLTKWTFGMLFTYYTCMVIVHILNTISVNSKLSYKLRRTADKLFTAIVLPAGMFITTIFWTIYSIDRELIFPSWLDQVIPGWVNHGIHTFNSVFPLVDLLLVKHTFSSWSDTIYYSAIYFGLYMICLFGTYFQHGVWLYPIFMKMTLLQSICFCMTGYFLVLVFHYISRLIGTRWGSSVVKLHQKEKNKAS